jgi:hypothetical protein
MPIGELKYEGILEPDKKFFNYIGANTISYSSFSTFIEKFINIFFSKNKLR